MKMDKELIQKLISNMYWLKGYHHTLTSEEHNARLNEVIEGLEKLRNTIDGIKYLEASGPFTQIWANEYTPDDNEISS